MPSASTHSPPQAQGLSGLMSRLSLRGRILLLVAGVLALSLSATVVAVVYTSSFTLQAKDDRELQVLSRMLARVMEVRRTLPQMAEDLVSDEMHSTALLLAELVALSERTGRPPAELRQTLQKLIRVDVADEFLVTDSQGRLYVGAPGNGPYQFSSNPSTHPQSSAFWGLLSGQTEVVKQATGPRDVDGKIFKYVGVAGVDKPRIVQLGYRGDYIQELRAAVGVESMASFLVQSKSLLFLYALDAQKPDAPVEGHGLADHPQLLPQLPGELRKVLADGRWRKQHHDAYELIFAPVRNLKGEVTGAMAIGYPPQSRWAELTHLFGLSLAIAVVVMGLTFALSTRLAQRLSQPINTLTHAARQVQQGNFAQLGSLDAVRRQPDEIGQLASVFQRMALEVKNREQVLDGLVQERTHQLTEKNAALEAAQKVIDSELHLGQKLQLGILPKAFPQVPGCQGAALVVPATTMGGDFFDYYDFKDGRVGLVVADVSGKGVTAAFFMALVRTGMLQLAWQHTDPAHCLSHGNRLLCTQNPLDMFVTVFYGVLDTRTGELTYANAGHNPPLLRTGDGAQAQTQMLASDGEMATGVMPDVQYRSHRIVLPPNSSLLLYSDGVTEAFNTEHIAFGEQRLQQCLQGLNTLQPQAVVDTVYQQLQAHTAGAAQSDDITLMAVHWQGRKLA